MISRNLGSSALAYLTARPGQKVGVQLIADFFECHETTMRKALNKLAWKKEIRSERTGNSVSYWFETAEKPTKAEPRESPITHKVYVLPAALAERGRELEAHREMNRSRHI